MRTSSRWESGSTSGEHTLTFEAFDRRLRAAIADGRVTLKERSVVLSVASNPVQQSMASYVLDANTPAIAYARHVLGRQTGGYSGTLVPVAARPTAGVVTYSDYGSGQGIFGTCSLLAAAAGLLRYQPNPNGTTSFRFYDKDTGRPRYVTVQNQRAQQGADGLLGVSEIAYATWAQMDGLTRPNRSGWAEVTDGNHVNEVLYALTGRQSTVWRSPTFASVANRFNRGQTVVLEALGGEYTESNHAYRVTGVTDTHVTFLNPWMQDGYQGTGADDGYITLDRQQFNTEFRSSFAHSV